MDAALFFWSVQRQRAECWDSCEFYYSVLPTDLLKNTEPLGITDALKWKHGANARGEAHSVSKPQPKSAVEALGSGPWNAATTTAEQCTYGSFTQGKKRCKEGETRTVYAQIYHNTASQVFKFRIWAGSA